MKNFFEWVYQNNKSINIFVLGLAFGLAITQLGLLGAIAIVAIVNHGNWIFASIFVCGILLLSFAGYCFNKTYSIRKKYEDRN